MQQIDSGVAIIRPPGHHAEVDETCGFCYFKRLRVGLSLAGRNPDYEGVRKICASLKDQT